MVRRDTVIVAETPDGTMRSKPMPRIQAEMLLVLAVRKGGILSARLERV